MKLTNPTGEKNITLKAQECLEIFLEDFDEGSRDFQLVVKLEGENAECHIQGRAQSKGTDRKTWQIKQIFKGKEQIGSIQLKGTAEGESFLEFDGSGTLTSESENAEAHIEENIILFDQAKGKSLPVLRVETDKVKSAGHGASIAPVDKEKVLYFQSRGVDKLTAKELLKEGFLQ